MFGLLAKAAAWATGSLVTPALIVGVLWTGGSLLQARREALIKQGEQKCEARWEVEIAQQQRDVALAQARAMSKQIAATDVLNMELKANAAEISRELDALRAAAAGADQRCVSDGVLDMARGVQGNGNSKSNPGSVGVKGRAAP